MGHNRHPDEGKKKISREVICLGKDTDFCKVQMPERRRGEEEEKRLKNSHVTESIFFYFPSFWTSLLLLRPSPLSSGDFHSSQNRRLLILRAKLEICHRFPRDQIDGTGHPSQSFSPSHSRDQNTHRARTRYLFGSCASRNVNMLPNIEWKCLHLVCLFFIFF